MMYKFTGRSEKALELAAELAAEFGHNYNFFFSLWALL